MALKKASPEALRPVVERTVPRNLPGLLTQLNADTADERRWAARDLRDHPEAAAAMGERLALEADLSVREALFTSLAAHASESAAHAVLGLLRSEDAGLRNGAIETLAEMPAATAPHINALLHDPDPDVRLFTVNLLADLRHPQVTGWLLHVLRHEPEVNVVAAAIEVLSEVGQPDHLTALRHVVKRFPDEPFIQFAADTAIHRIEAD